MLRKSTKTDLERENEETERLVRPAPKYRPPRHDRRRETIDTDKDPDIDGDPDIARDNDRSRNFKDVGGSLLIRAQRLATVFTRRADADKVQVRTKDTGRVVYVSPDTLKENGAKYVPIEKDEPSAPEKDEPEEGEWQEQATNRIRDLIYDDPSVEGKLSGDLPPNTPIDDVFKGLSQLVPSAIKTLDDLLTALVKAPKFKRPKDKKAPEPKKKRPAPEAKPEAKPEKVVPDKPAKEPPATDEEPKKAPPLPPKDEPLPPKDEPVPAKEAPETEKPVEPEPEKPVEPEVSDKSQPGLDKQEAPQPPGTTDQPQQQEPEVKPKKGPPPEKRRPVNVSEQKEALLLIQDTFPKHIAVDLIKRDMHPDDVAELAATYSGAKHQAMKEKNLSDFVAKASRNYETDLEDVPPPNTVKKDGKDIPLADLSSSEQAAAVRKHQLRTLAMSMAAREAVSNKLSMESIISGKPVVPREVTDTLASFMLRGGGPNEAAKLKDAMRDIAMSAQPHKMSDGQTAKFLKQLPLEAKGLAVSYFQGNDISRAKAKFIGEGLGKFTERDSARTIINGLSQITKFMEDRAKVYGADAAETAGPLKLSVLHKLRALDPKKYVKVRNHIDHADAKVFDAAMVQWEKDHAKWQKASEGYENKRGPRDPAFDEPEPKPPTKPARYDIVRSKTKGNSEDFWSEESEEPKAKPADSNKPSEPKPSKQAMRLATRFAISSCNPTLSMTRSAAYHGVDPKEHAPTPNPGWAQPHQRDFTDSDFQTIVKSAREWLKTPVLSAREGWPREDQLRAALDLSIFSGPYNGQINTVHYAKLLTMLGGGSKISHVSSCRNLKGEMPMGNNVSASLRKIAVQLVAESPAVGYELYDLADRTAKYAKLRQAIEADPVTFKALLPLIQELG